MYKDKTLEEVEKILRKECRGLSSSRTIEYILSLELFSDKRCKVFLARRMVAELISKGMHKMEAIKQTALRLGQSCATIRNYIYNNFKN